MKVSPLSFIGQFNPKYIPIHSCSTFTSHAFRFKQRNIVYPFVFLGDFLFSSPIANDPPSWIEPSEQEVQWNYFPDQDILTETNDDRDFSELNDEEDPSSTNSPLYNASLFSQTEDSWISSLIYGYRWW
jgi:hypothetical protein